MPLEAKHKHSNLIINVKYEHRFIVSSTSNNMDNNVLNPSIFEYMIFDLGQVHSIWLYIETMCPLRVNPKASKRPMTTPPCIKTCI